jgi:hypothetical protein
MQILKALLVAWLLAHDLALAQLMPVGPDWQESAVPPPPAFDLNRLIRVPGPDGSTLKFGIDPDTVTVTPEGIVRYVIVATSPDGGRNVMYEGIRCNVGQHRIYARHNAATGWTVQKDSEWQSLYGSATTRHAQALSLAGVCKDRAVNRSAANIVRTLKSELPGGYD